MQNSPELKIAIAEENEITMTGLCLSLNVRRQFKVVIKACNGEVLLEQINTVDVDIVLLDLLMPGIDGIETLKLLKAFRPDIKVIMLAQNDESARAREAIAAGADGYCLKDIRVERLRQVIPMVMEGTLYLDRQVSREVMGLLPPNLQDRVRSFSGNELTAKELEVLSCISKGMSNLEIATFLELSIHTVKVHVCKVLQKLNVTNRKEAVLVGIRDHLFSLNLLTP